MSVICYRDTGTRNNIEMEVRSKANSDMAVRNYFDPEVSDSLRREWEKDVLLHLNNVNLVKRDDCKTS